MCFVYCALQVRKIPPSSKRQPRARRSENGRVVEMDFAWRPRRSSCRFLSSSRRGPRRVFFGGTPPSCLFTRNRLLVSTRPSPPPHDHPGHLHRPTAPGRCGGRPRRCAGTGRCRRGACGGAWRSSAFACYSHANVPHMPADRMTLILNDIFSNILVDLPTMMPDV